MKVFLSSRGIVGRKNFCGFHNNNLRKRAWFKNLARRGYRGKMQGGTPRVELSLWILLSAKFLRGLLK